MRILITGATGFIGRALVQEARQHGHLVIALSRSEITDMPGVEWYRWNLGESFPEALEGVDAACHLAHDFRREDGAKLTIEGTKLLAEAIADRGCSRQIFFSSYSAGEHAESTYGRTKTVIEQFFLGLPGGIIVRPGLVIGGGGIYRKIAMAAACLPVVPLPDGGRGEVPIVSIEQLCERILAIAEHGFALREINLFEPKLVTLRSLVTDAAHKAGKAPLILSIPSTLLLFGLGLAKRLHIVLPIGEDNLKGFLSNQSALHLATPEEFF